MVVKSLSMGIDMIAIVGPTAGGKTGFAAKLASLLDAEIISADSRQVYRRMDLGTGKDYADYQVDGVDVPFHLIDIVDAGYKYNVYEYQKDFLKVYESMFSRGKLPLLCGGTGMYIEAVLKGYRLIEVPVNQELRDQLSGKTLQELATILKKYKKLHNTSDVDTAKRAIRAIEIEEYYAKEEVNLAPYPKINPLIFGIKFDRDLRRRRISERLSQRLDEGMVNEVKSLLNSGVKPEDLIYYGLEYKFLTEHVLGNLTFDEMFRKLETAIHQFAKRQMTWFRGMERRGFSINWIDGNLPMAEKIDIAMDIILDN